MVVKLQFLYFSDTELLVYRIFSDDRWKVHPDWVYCNYHHHQNFTSPEQNLIHFLERLTEVRTEGEEKWGKPLLSQSSEESLHYCKYSLIKIIKIPNNEERSP